MFGLGDKPDNSDQMPVAVHVVRSAEAFADVQKLWTVNGRSLYQDQGSGKELLHFSLLNPKTTIWLQHDNGRQDEFELVMSWAEKKVLLAEVFIILPSPDKAGDDAFVRKILGALLTTPATVPVASKN